MIDRRTLIALAASIPPVRPTALLDAPDPRLDPFETGHVKIFGISPDAATLVGHIEERRLAFVDAGTGETLTETETLSDFGLVNIQTAAWSPDSTRFAYALHTDIFPADSGIYVVDVASGEVTNISEPQGEVSATPEPDTLYLYTHPIWLDDETMQYIRFPGISDSEYRLDFMNRQLSTGESSQVLNLTPHGIRWVESKIWHLSNGDLIFWAVLDEESYRNGVFRLTPDGDLAEIRTGEFEWMMRLVDANETHLLLHDELAFEWIYTPLDEAEDAVPIWDHFAMPEDWTQLSAPVLGNEPDSMIVVLETSRGIPSAHLFDDGDDRQLGQLQGTFDRQTLHLASDSILIAGESDSWLVPMSGVAN